MKSITQDNHQMESLNQKIATFFEQYAIGKLLRTANTNKLKGIPAMQVFLLVVCTVFRQGSLYMQMHLHPEQFSFGKDVVYRFMNSCRINWRRFTTLLAEKIIRETIAPLTSEERRNVFIIDDSLFSRNRSKTVELLARGFRPCASEVCLRISHADCRLVGWQHILARQSLPAFDGKCQKPHQ